MRRGRRTAGEVATAGFTFNMQEAVMMTVRVSPVEVQVDVLVYTFNDVAVADGFEASAQAEARAHAAASPEFLRHKCMAVGCRPVDCDHEVGRF